MKYLLLVALIGAAFAAGPNAASPVCSSTNGYETKGVCQFKTNPICATQSTTIGQCATCSGGVTVASGACNCASGNSPKADNTCQADSTSAHLTCPLGYGSVKDNSSTANYRCFQCAGSCANCQQDLGGAFSTWAAGTHDIKCSACFDSGAALSGTTCGAGTTNVKLVPHVGWFATCPPGYKDGTAPNCDLCAPGCYSCGTDATKCTGCAEGYLLDATAGTCTAVAANGATGGCDASCGDKKCQNTAKNCTACATGFQLTAAGTCTDFRVPRCKTPNATNDACTDTGCDTGFTLAADKKSCLCPAHQRNTVVAYAAKTATTAEVFYSNTCEACGVTCASPKQCKQDATDKTKDTCVDAAPATVSNVSVTCADSALVAANCATCADGKCTACLNATLLATDCTKCIADHVKKTATECVPLGSCKAADCTDGKVCGWNTTTSKVECITAPVETTAAATNGLLLSAISMIAALILA